jgi:hypothetical protein
MGVLLTFLTGLRSLHPAFLGWTMKYAQGMLYGSVGSVAPSVLPYRTVRKGRWGAEVGIVRVLAVMIVPSNA